ncbi:Hypothetical protein PSM36_3265 [Proteiniphilum saccharofermentans]|uniref:Uncharacterized protein n=1 Tax=Proteiniphilum saccharofermentans TaxID=1642647 RepID=A0A1R3T4B5_9BACT|nr:hypothetical protein [Proteiniphilum saccharofermentans]SCD22050.1 Hypothetical protein PSM36_3265 [Proteiniphilum saccharofermentans]
MYHPNEIKPDFNSGFQGYAKFIIRINLTSRLIGTSLRNPLLAIPQPLCASDLKIVSKKVFTKYKGNALSSEEFADFINKNEIDEFYLTGADAIASKAVKPFRK